MCGWNHASKGLNWQRRRGDQASWSSGPREDATTGTGKGRLLVICLLSVNAGILERCHGESLLPW